MSGNFAIKGGGGVGRLMANAILNFHFDFLHTSLSTSWHTCALLSFPPFYLMKFVSDTLLLREFDPSLIFPALVPIFIPPLYLRKFAVSPSKRKASLCPV